MFFSVTIAIPSVANCNFIDFEFRHIMKIYKLKMLMLFTMPAVYFALKVQRLQLNVCVIASNRRRHALVHI